MTCQDRDPDLLLLGLGELSVLRRLSGTLHIRRCSRCRDRMSELLRASAQIAEALRPPSGTGGGGLARRAPRPGRPAVLGASAVFLALLIGLFTLTAVTVWQVRTRSSAARFQAEVPCRPGLPNDRCR